MNVASFGYGQHYVELINSGESSLTKIEQAANQYFKKFGKKGNDYKFYNGGFTELKWMLMKTKHSPQTAFM